MTSFVVKEYGVDINDILPIDQYDLNQLRQHFLQVKHSIDTTLGNLNLCLKQVEVATADLMKVPLADVVARVKELCKMMSRLNVLKSEVELKERDVVEGKNFFGCNTKKLLLFGSTISLFLCQCTTVVVSIWSVFSKKVSLSDNKDKDIVMAIFAIVQATVLLPVNAWMWKKLKDIGQMQVNLEKDKLSIVTASDEVTKKISVTANTLGVINSLLPMREKGAWTFETMTLAEQKWRSMELQEQNKLENLRAALFPFAVEEGRASLVTRASSINCGLSPNASFYEVVKPLGKERDEKDILKRIDTETAMKIAKKQEMIESLEGYLEELKGSSSGNLREVNSNISLIEELKKTQEEEKRKLEDKRNKYANKAKECWKVMRRYTLSGVDKSLETQLQELEELGSVRADIESLNDDIKKIAMQAEFIGQGFDPRQVSLMPHNKQRRFTLS
jgi:hypothetical protein